MIDKIDATDYAVEEREIQDLDNERRESESRLQQEERYGQ